MPVVSLFLFLVFVLLLLQIVKFMRRTLSQPRRVFWPQELQDLIEFDHFRPGSLASLRLFLDVDASRYIPIDAVPFARVGVDGMVYSFLTDFNDRLALSEAPIVITSPGEDPIHRIVAENFSEFLSYLLGATDAYLLPVSDAQDLSDMKQLHQSLRSVEERLVHDEALHFLSEQLQVTSKLLTPKRLEQLRNVRAKHGIATSDGLYLKGETKSWNPVSFRMELATSDKVVEYIRSSNALSRKWMYREFAYFFDLIDEDTRNELRTFLLTSMKKDGYKREAQVLQQRYSAR